MIGTDYTLSFGSVRPKPEHDGKSGTELSATGEESSELTLMKEDGTVQLIMRS